MMAQMTTLRPDPSDRAPDRAVRVLFVCTGNICRSPMAEVVLRDLAERTPLGPGGSLATRLVVESAGTSRWHEGAEMDERARRALDARGYRRAGSTARQVTAAQLARADVVVALDRGHRADLRVLDSGCEPRLLREPGRDGEALDVADPYYGGDVEFDHCLDQIVTGCGALVAELAAALA
jgi:protein-tyrosine phosphatase